MDFIPNFEDIQSGGVTVGIEEPERHVEEIPEPVPSQARTFLFEDEFAWAQTKLLLAEHVRHWYGGKQSSTSLLEAMQSKHAW